jgi:opacity protein-like surface antigen
MTVRGSAVFAIAAVSFLSSLAVANAAEAGSAETGWRGRFWVGTVGRYVLDDNAAYQSPPFGTVETEVDGSALGFGGDVEYKFKRWLGLDTALAYTSLPVTFQTSTDPGVTQDADFTVIPLFVALNFHVVNTEKVDFWLGPQIAYVVYPDSLSFSVPGVGTFEYDPSNLFSPFGFDLGIDIAFNPTWAVNVAVRFQNADGDPDGHLTIDPTFVTVGMTARF